MRRFGPALIAVALVGMILPLLVGMGPGTMLYLVPVFTAMAGLGLLAVRRSPLPEPGWSGTAAGIDVGLATAAPGSQRVRPPSWRVAAALARVEARDLVASPCFAVGLGFLVVTYLAFAGIWGGDSGDPWVNIIGLAPWLAHPMVGMAVLASHRSATRARRDGADELFDTCPTAPATRTWGLLGAAWVPVPALVLFFVAYGVTVAIRSPNVHGSPGSGAVPQVLSALVLGVGGVALGVTLGRWVHFALAPVVTVVAVGFLALKLATIGDPGWNPLQQLSTFPPLSSQQPVFEDAADWSHLAWLLALTGGVLVLAQARHRRDRTVAVAAVAAGLLLAVTGVAATRPMPGSSAARIAGFIADPPGHQVCRPAASLRVCAYPGSEELVARVVGEVTPVAGALPDGGAALGLRQRFPGQLEDLPPEVARRLPAGVPARPADEVALGYSASRRSLLVARMAVAAHASGLPTEPAPGNQPLVISGQARGVVALWLATRGLGPGSTRTLTSGRLGRDLGGRTPDAFDRGFAWPDCIAPVVWSAQDLLAARAVTALPDDVVRTVIHRAWDRWLDPQTGTDELLGARGLRPTGPFDAFSTRSESPSC